VHFTVAELTHISLHLSDSGIAAALQFPYLTFVRKLAAAAPRGTPIVVAEAPHISLRLCQGGQVGNYPWCLY